MLGIVHFQNKCDITMRPEESEARPAVVGLK